MLFKKPITIIVICAFFLSSCVSNGTQQNSLAVGPLFSSSLFKTEVKEDGVEKPKLDVVIPVFDPGLPESKIDGGVEIWPELRRAEATRFAYKLKLALEDTNAFGAVRVTPDKTATGDLYVLGKIVESNGEEVEIDIRVFDISGKAWLDNSYNHEVGEDFHKDQRNKGKDSYDVLFDEAAAEIADELKYYSADSLENLKYIADLRFAANFSDDAFKEHLNTSNGLMQLVSKPSDDDPMLIRIKAIRVRDQLFIDNLQAHYSSFSGSMNESYLLWQEQSLMEVVAAREASQKATAEAIGGVLLITLAIAAAVAGANSSSVGGTTAGIAGATIGGVAGASLLQSSFQTSDEAKVHRDALNELGQSIDMEIAPKVIKFEKKTVELTGSSKEQFDQWRVFLKEIYLVEATPDVLL